MVGENELLVLLHRIGETTFSHVPGQPGVAFIVASDAQPLAASGPSCEWRHSPHYRSGTMPRITAQLGFGFDYDAMGDHYEDTPWREQALYANDALNQSLAGYAAFGEIQYAQVSLDLLGGGLRDDGFLELCAPAQIPITIPAFSFAWILGVWRNVEFSGDAGFARLQMPRVEAILEKALARLERELLPSPEGSGYWHFYDWTAGGMDGTVGGDATRFAVLEHTRFDAPFNAFLILALEAGSRLAHCAEATAEAESWAGCTEALRNHFTAAFWDKATGLFRSFGSSDHVPPASAPCELVQSLGLLARCCPAAHAGSLRLKVLAPAESGLVPASLSQSLHTFESLLPHSEFHPALSERIRRTWGAMLTSGATAYWETADAGWAFDRAGSLCHGWSAIPVYVFHRIAEGLADRSMR